MPKTEGRIDEDQSEVDQFSGNKEEYMLGVGDWVVNEPELAKEQNKIFDRFHDRLLEIIKPPVVKDDKPIWPLRLGMIGKELKHVQFGLIVVDHRTIYNSFSIHFFHVEGNCSTQFQAIN